MLSRRIREHTIDILFPLAVFFAFAASAVMAVLLAANIYGSAVEGSEGMYNGSTALSYIQEKLHRGDAAGAVDVQTLADTTVLVIEHSYGGQDYRTYLYAWEGSLRELFAREELPFDPADGRAVLAVRDVSCRWLAEGVLEVRCTDENGWEGVACIGLISGEE